TAVTFWPTTLFALPAIRAAIVERTLPAIRFLLAWTVPNWLMFELVPTKLPHYILPVYPALALLAAMWITQAFDPASRSQRVLRIASVTLFAAAALGATVASAVALHWFGIPISPLPVVAMAVAMAFAA